MEAEKAETVVDPAEVLGKQEASSWVRSDFFILATKELKLPHTPDSDYRSAQHST